jgi:voltage-gated potassium channel Kch
VETESIMTPVNHLLVVCALIYMAATTRRHLLIAGVLGFGSIATEVLSLLLPDLAALTWLQPAFSVALYLYVFWLMIRELFTARRADATTLLLAVNCYLLIGLVWTLAYMLVESLSPGSFLLAGDPDLAVWKHLYYFSYVTLTTLGYGDIQPVTALARSLAIIEAVCGVLFTGILVARLVGLYSAEQK